MKIKWGLDLAGPVHRDIFDVTSESDLPSISFVGSRGSEDRGEGPRSFLFLTVMPKE